MEEVFESCGMVFRDTKENDTVAAPITMLLQRKEKK
jgi:hypothetical protein